MKYLNLTYLWRKTLNTFFRFPLPVVFILISFVSIVVNVYFDGKQYFLMHLFLTSILAIPLFTAFNLYLERVETSRKFNFIINLVGFIILTVFYISLPDKSLFLKHYYRSIVLFLGFVASIFYLPFIGFHQQMPFWYYNKHFIKRIFVSLFYSFVLHLGISLALVSINLLFDVGISYKWYAYVAIFSYLFIFPWLVLVGLPRKFTYHAQKEYYPKELKTFATYVLVPLNVIYAAILFVYILKIIITGVWPSGWTVSLILGYTIIVLLIVILTFPVLFDKDNKLLLKYVYVSFILTLIFLGIYFLAISKRISEYGLTENRLFTILIGIWMLFNVSFLFIKKIKDLRVIPLSFLLLSFLSVSGPWNVFRISKTQQIKRLERILVKNDLLNNGKIDAKNKTINAKTQAEISSISLYLVETHGESTLKPYFNVNIDSLFNSNESLPRITYEKMSTLFSSVGLSFNPYYFENSDDSYIQFYTQERLSSLSVDSSLYFCILNVYSYDNSVVYKQTLQLNDSLRLDLFLSKNDDSLNIYINNKKDAVLNLTDYYNYLKTLKSNEQYPNSIMLKSNELKKSIMGSVFKYEFIFERLEFLNKNNKTAPVSISGYLLIKK